MLKYNHLTLLGTSHIAKESVDQVKISIDDIKPDIIALELDKKRLYALLQNKKSKLKFKDIMNIGIKGYLFSKLGAWVENKLGDYVGVPPGSEMIAAAKLAKKQKIALALIDQDIEITLKQLSKNITWKEKGNFVVDLLKGIIKRKKELPFDIRTVPNKSIIKELTQKVKVRFPGVYKTLIEDRNKIMAKRIAYLIQNNPEKKILAIIGAGHEDEMLKIIKANLNVHKSDNYNYSFS